MRAADQRGIILLPVMLALAIIGALAYSMTRDAGMGVAAIDAEYDIARVRYLAEAGITLAKWQNEQEGCGHNDRQTGTLAFPGGTVTIDAVRKINHGVSVDVTAKLTRPGATAATLKLTRDMRLHGMGSKTEITLGDRVRGSDTHIQRNSAALYGSAAYLEMTDSVSHGLLRFHLGDLPKDILVTKSDLRLTVSSIKTLAAPKRLGVHRVTTDWNAAGVSWSAPWAQGGAAESPLVAGADVRTSGTHLWRVDGLVQAWANGALPNYGFLLKPEGLTEARFHSFQSGSSSPELFVRYYPLCPKN